MPPVHRGEATCLAELASLGALLDREQSHICLYACTKGKENKKHNLVTKKNLRITIHSIAYEVARGQKSVREKGAPDWAKSAARGVPVLAEPGAELEVLSSSRQWAWQRTQRLY